MEIESRLTPQSVMNPRTPSSMEMMEKATHREQIGFGIKIKETTIMTAAAITTH